jgi:serine/threonine protein kinase/WD40 repeat protein
LLADQRSRWDRGERVPVEHFLSNKPGLRDNTEVLLDLIYAEVVLRREAGETPTVDEYVARFPALAEPIRTQFEVDFVIDSGMTHPGPGGADDFQVFPQAPPGYEILEEIGRGGMGVVYKARHRALDRLVALKMIRTGEFADRDDRVRFEAEARAVAKLSHPNVIQIFEIGELNGLPYLALEYVAGESLADALRGDPFSPRPAAMLAATLARAIQHAHEAGIVHRDLKPANILLQKATPEEAKTKSGDPPPIDKGRNAPWDTEVMSFGAEISQLDADVAPKITDFGLVKRIGADGPTKTGDFLGTPNFAPPEQATGQSDLGPAADIYSLGAILYQMLTGRPPFAGATPLETLDQVRFAEPVPPSRLRPKLPRDLETITLMCLRKETTRRYPSASALADDLDRFLNGQVIRARPVGTFERIGKWCRRRPAIAGLLAFTILLATASMVTVTVLWQQAAKARDAEGSARKDERGQRERAESRSAELLISNARYAWSTDDIDGARKALAECEESYRTDEWRYLNRACAASNLIVPPDSQPIECIAISRDGTMLAGSVNSNRIVVWDSTTGKELLSVFLPGRSARAITFTNDGRVAAMTTGASAASRKIAKDAYSVVFVDPANPRVRIPWEYPGRPFRMTIAPGGRHAGVIMENNSPSAKLIDATTGEVNQHINTLLPNASIRAISFSPDGQFFATSETPHELRIWDTRTGLLARNFSTRETFYGVNIHAAGPDGTSIAVGVQSTGLTTDLLLLNRNDDVRRFAANPSMLREIAYSMDGRWIATIGNATTVIRVWNAQTGQEEIIFRGHPSRVQSIAFRSDGRVVLWNLER